MSDLIVARLENGSEKPVPRFLAEKAGLEVLDEPAVLPNGNLRRTTRKGGRPKKARTSVATEAAAKKAVTEPANDQKEKDQ